MTRWPVERPSLPYHTAFDFCAAEISRCPGRVAILASSSLYARELVRRLDSEVLLYVLRGMRQDDLGLEAGLGARAAGHRVRPLDLGNLGSAGPLAAILWAEPERDTWQEILSALQGLSPVPGLVCVLGTTKLRRLLPEWQGTIQHPGRAPLGKPQQVARALGALGFAALEVYGFHGLPSLFWGVASRLPAALGREDLVDRCYAAMRQAYVVRGWQARWAPVWMIIGRRYQ